MNNKILTQHSDIDYPVMAIIKKDSSISRHVLAKVFGIRKKHEINVLVKELDENY